MSIEEIKEYLDYCLQGQSTIPQREIILEEKKQGLLEQMNTLQESIDYIHSKKQFYNDVLSGKIEYKSNLRNQVVSK